MTSPIVRSIIELSESHSKQNYIYARYVSGVLQHALKNYDKMKGQIYNVGLAEANISKLDICRHIQKQCSDFVFVEAPMGSDPDQRNYIVSNAMIEAIGRNFL